MNKILPINDITITTRIRKNVGDISSLAASIQKLGLLSPVVINEDNELLAGERRLTACKSIGWTEIPVIVMSATDAEEKLFIEIEENQQRKSFTREEIINAGIELERIEKVKADERMKNSGNQYTERGVENFPQGKTRDIVAAKLGMSGKQYEREKFIIEYRYALSPGEFDDWNNRIVSTNKVYVKIKRELNEEKQKQKEVIKEVEIIPEGYISPEEYIKMRDEYIADLRYKGELGFGFIEGLQKELEETKNEIEKYKKQIGSQNEKISLLEENNRMKEQRLDELEGDASIFIDAAFLERSKNDVYRGSSENMELYQLAKDVRILLESKLAPVEFKRCFERIPVSENARANLKDLVNNVSKWVDDMRRTLDREENVIDVDEVNNKRKFSLYAREA
jgi:ParB family chromosome partitioning protein